jgi:hypothetical protein
MSYQDEDTPEPAPKLYACPWCSKMLTDKQLDTHVEETCEFRMNKPRNQ